MDLTKVEVKAEDAEELYKQYLEVVKVRKEKQYEDLKKVYRALSKGYKVIDIFKAFEDTGMTEDGDPKLAIAQADKREVYFHKRLGGGGVFSHDQSDWKTTVKDVELPGGIFSEWLMNEPDKGRSTWNIKKRTQGTNVPLIPAHLLPEGKLENYFILFEVDEWREIATVADPYLLRRINANTFIVLAEWDVTEVEAIVMRGV